MLFIFAAPLCNPPGHTGPGGRSQHSDLPGAPSPGVGRVGGAGATWSREESRGPQAAPAESCHGIFLLGLQRKDDKRAKGEPKAEGVFAPLGWLTDGAELSGDPVVAGPVGCGDLLLEPWPVCPQEHKAMRLPTSFAWASPSPLPLQFFILYLLGGMFARPSETLLHLNLFSALPSL